jgi:threonine dehydrogenase-like Zn-dependent dehydrogenase
MDGAPLLGEQIAVFGQGVIGLMVTALLGRLSPASLVTIDRYPLRRAASRELGAHASLDPFGESFVEKALSLLQGNRPIQGADLAFEVSGNPDALSQAIAVTGFSGRIVIGSWYGQKPVATALGGFFHRSRIRLISSQVSTLSPEHSGRWNKERLRQQAWQTLREISPSGLITHRFPMAQADQAYELLAGDPRNTLQVVFTYE